MEQPAVTIIDSAATVRLSGEFAMEATFTNRLEERRHHAAITISFLT